MQDYTVTHNDETETIVENIQNVKQVYGFLEFRDARQELVVGLRADTILRYGPSAIAQPALPGFTTRSTAKKITGRRG